MSDNVMFVVGAFALTWVVLLAYLVRLESLVRRARAALTRVRAPRTGV